MNDQASALRQIVKNLKSQRTRIPGEGARIVCVTSGKGGVGKTNFTVNLALSLTKKGLRVLIIDADFGLANVDVVMGVTTRYDLSHVIRREVTIRDAVSEGPGGVRIISGGSGVLELLTLGETQLSLLMDKLLLIDDLADIILFDTGAGVSPNILKLVESSEEIIVVTTPEPTAIMDAYALVKTVTTNAADARIRLVVNKAESVAEAQDALHKFAAVVRLYLGVELEALGYIQNDPTVGKSVRLQRPFVLSFPRCQASRDIDAICWRFMNLEPERSRRGLRQFLSNLISRNQAADSPPASRDDNEAR